MIYIFPMIYIANQWLLQNILMRILYFSWNKLKTIKSKYADLYEYHCSAL